MAWRSSGTSNAGLIANLAANKLITSDRVKNAMLSVDRAHYARYDPYDDSPQPIGHGATISAPHMHAHACESLLQFLPLASAIASSTSSSSSAAAASPSAPSAASASAARPPLRILDIGSGSGYLTHVLAALAGPDARVVGLDHLAPLVELARANLRKSEDGRALLDSGRVKLVTADGRKGWPEDAPYDAIHVGAAASEAHSTLLEQLKAPGRLFIPVEGSLGDQYIWVYDKDAEGHVTKEKLFGVRYVPLTDAPK